MNPPKLLVISADDDQNIHRKHIGLSPLEKEVSVLLLDALPGMQLLKRSPSLPAF